MRPQRRFKPGMDGGLTAAVLLSPPLHLRTLDFLSKRWGPPQDEETGKYFVSFSEQLKLKEVIAGVRFPFSRGPIEDAIKGYSEHVKIIKAGQGVERFEIIVDDDGFDRVVQLTGQTT